ncbi:MAG TPA: YsnF/AvaK domain-containing protein [Burkholderiales bacterium]|nr:YsnF/AvaK domain-containing protein [Burkholderiales bacterium]
MASESEPVVIPVAREDAAIHRERVETGVVRVRKIVHERTELIDEPMLHDEVDIEHVAINRPVNAPEPPREEGDVLVIPVYEEVVTVQRQWILKEEVRLRRREVQTRHREQVVLRAEEALVERLATKREGST